MADKSSIEWTDATWNPVTGCSKVSPGCAHCYAEALTMRYAKSWGVPGLPWSPKNAAANVILKPERLTQPLRWKQPRMVFVNSMSDLFHEQIPAEYIAQVFGVIARAPQHTFQVLTKRPERMVQLLAEEDPDFVAAWTAYQPPDFEWPLPNVWLGTSIENRRFVNRADLLRDVPAAVRFISAEPLLGPLLPDADYMVDADGDRYQLGEADFRAWRPWADDYDGPGLDLTGIDWLIVGGESGPKHRPFDWSWARDLKWRCADDVWDHDGREGFTAFFVKQGGGYRPGDRLEDLPEDLRIREFPTREVLA